MTHVLGWWEYDPVSPGMVNTVTGERVVFRGALGGHMRVTWSESWLRYDYVHSELTFPLIARASVGDSGGRDVGSRAEYLSVDYSRSARLWRDDPFGNQVIGTAPAYGVWRRVDDCIVDAFACWPYDTTGSWKGDTVEFLGGWLNGSWRPDFSRLCSAGHEPDETQTDHSDATIEAPALMDLWAKPPSVWRAADPSRFKAIGSAVAADKTGMTDHVVFLSTDDGLSLICAPSPENETVSNSAVFLLVQKSQGRETPFVLDRNNHVGSRHLRLSLSLLSGSDASQGNHDWWRASGWSVVDAFAAWHYEPSVQTDVESALIEWAPARLTVSGCFRGGLPIADARCDVFYAR